MPDPDRNASRSRSYPFLDTLRPTRPQGTPTPAARPGQRRLILDAVLLGLAGVVAAQLFTWLLRGASWAFLQQLAGYHPPGLVGEGGSPVEVIGPHGLWLIPVATTIGGLLVGMLTAWLAPEAEGHGTDTAVRAFHRTEGFLRGRVPPIKMVASAITIGSGGAAGREGPIALVAAGIGSWYATIIGRSERQRRMLLLCGMAAGLAAIFRSPIGTALFAVEVLYAEMEFEAGVLLYTLLASIVAYAVNGIFVGWDPLFELPPRLALLPHSFDYAWYLVLGIAAGVLATALPVVFYRLRDFFRALPLPLFLKPALGGLLAGLVAVAFPQVIGGGYGWIQQAIDGRMLLGGLAVLVFAKMLAMGFTVASGGSGGVFAPSLFIGAMLGGAVAHVFNAPPAPFVIVGMGAVFAGAAHVPLATLMMVTEMTGGYTLLVPAALAVTLSYLVQNRLSVHLRDRSLYEAQVQSRADSPAHHSQHLSIAMRLLQQKQVPNLADVGELELLPLLRSGLPVELPAGRRLMIGVLKKDSPFVNTTVSVSGRQLDGGGANIIAILRGEHMLVPRPDTVFEAGDRLMLVTTEDGLEQARKNLAPW